MHYCDAGVKTEITAFLSLDDAKLPFLGLSLG
jgi:hypothetical protein